MLSNGESQMQWWYSQNLLGETASADEVNSGIAHNDTSELQAKLDDLPSFDEICIANVYTREFLGKGHLQKAKREYLACIANVVRHNRSDAWKHIGTARDSHHHQLCRIAWTEL